MLNIFNLFLFLLLLWLGLMLSAAHVSFAYFLFGILFCSLISIGSFKLGLIQKESELLYLSLGFYRHFLSLYTKNFFSALNLIINLSLSKKPIRPLLYSVSLDYYEKFNPALAVASINISAGLFCIGIKEKFFYIHAIDEKYFQNFDLFKMKKNLPQINDDNLV